MTETAIRKQKMRAEVLRHETLAPGIRSLELRIPELPAAARPGQFVGVYTGDGAMLLPRPISICDSGDEKELRLVYRVAGKGTAEIAGLEAGEETQILGILGNGYPVEELKNKRVLLLGGGIGIPPMLLLAKQLSALNNAEEKEQSPVITVLGYRDAQMFLREEFEKYAQVFIATEDGSVGTKGNVLTAVKQEGIRADAICACGPMPMLRAVKAYAAQEDRLLHLPGGENGLRRRRLPRLRGEDDQGRRALPREEHQDLHRGTRVQRGICRYLNRCPPHARSKRFGQY